MTKSTPEPLLRLAHTADKVTDTLGPGRRAVVWVQGCSIQCPGCIVPESWGPRAGTLVDPRELAASLLGDTTHNLTVSGGEPTEQAAAVAALLEQAKQMGRTTWVYTGRRLDDLVAEADDDVLLMLSRVDVLVDGPYEQHQAGGVGYRGSRNQRLLRLTDAYSVAQLESGRPGKIELRLNGDDDIELIGIPEPHTLVGLRRGLAQRGITLKSRHWR